MLSEARRLYAFGFAIHWIKPNSKAPVKAGWSGPVRDDLETVEKEYRNGYGLGVRLGEPSALVGGGFLANLDIDIKSSDPRHSAEALAFLAKRFPNLRGKAPAVRTGYGIRLFVRTKTPLKSGKLGASAEETVVKMPTTEINKRQRLAVEEGKLTAAQLEAGFRVRPAWEVEFMSAGKQVVLPPSIHPETGRPYKWVRPLRSVDELPFIVMDGAEVTRAPGRPPGAMIYNFKPVQVDMDLDFRAPPRIVDMILHGTGVEDRSAACFTVTMALLKAGFSDDEILTVLTDRETFLGETAFDHRHTDSRAAAAAWARDYCLRKAKHEVSAARAFQDEVEVGVVLTDAEAAAQTAELVGAEDWRLRLKRTGKDGAGPPAPTLANVLLILREGVSKALFCLDQFADREFYGCGAPWAPDAKGRAVADIDAVLIKEWISRKFKFEPSTPMVFDAIGYISSCNAFHPVRTELESLPPWDGEFRLDTWLARHFGAKGPPEYLAQVFRKWLVASITRTYEPGAKFDWIPIFEGAQGTGKSSFGAILFGQQYFADWLPVLSDKDAALGLQGRRCVEFGELDSLRRNEVDTIKAFVTRQVDKVRPPYGRKVVEIWRQCVFFGTTNREEYFQDETGNRRFNPVEVGQLDFAALARDREQLWAEALFNYRNGLETTLYLEGSAVAHATEAHEEKMVLSDSAFMAEEILIYLNTMDKIPEAERFDFRRFRVSELFNGMNGPLRKWKEDAKNLQKAGVALRSLTRSKNLLRVNRGKLHGGVRVWGISGHLGAGYGAPR